MNTRRWLVGAVSLLALTAGTACSSQTDAPSAQAPAAKDQASSLRITDVWVKTAPSGLSAAFGVLHNDGDSDVTVAAATSSASPVMELHETVASADGERIMREKAGGFVVPAGGEYILEPGANHLMLMDIRKAVRAGEEVEFSLRLGDGSNFNFKAPAKDYSGANERYVPDSGR
jgi:copper(I)-binding protein